MCTLNVLENIYLSQTRPPSCGAPAGGAYRGTSPIRNSPLLGPFSRTVYKALWWPRGEGIFSMSKEPLYIAFAGTATSPPSPTSREVIPCSLETGAIITSYASHQWEQC